MECIRQVNVVQASGSPMQCDFMIPNPDEMQSTMSFWGQKMW